MKVLCDYEHENSIKVPLIASHPGQIPKGRSKTVMVGNLVNEPVQEERIAELEAMTDE